MRNRWMISALIAMMATGCMVVQRHGGGPPPHVPGHVRLNHRPRIVVIPGIDVHYAPELEFDLYFHSGLWYYPLAGVWYYSRDYDGPWIEIEAPPAVFYQIPEGYYKSWVPPGQARKITGEHPAKGRGRGRGKKH